MGSPIVIDLETYGRWDALPEAVRDGIKSRAERRAIPGPPPETTCALTWTRAKVITIGVHIVDAGRTAVLYESPEPSGREGFYAFATERELLAAFWARLRPEHRPIVTFNGRGFDLPTLANRSTAMRVPYSRNLDPHRYSYDDACDLIEVLTHHGAGQYVSLDETCHAFGIPTPKTTMGGHEVGAAYEAGRFLEIAEYCARDVEAEGGVFKVLREMGRIPGQRTPVCKAPAAPAPAAS